VDEKNLRAIIAKKNTSPAQRMAMIQKWRLKAARLGTSYRTLIISGNLRASH
jgi:hypothetical protein